MPFKRFYISNNEDMETKLNEWEKEKIETAPEGTTFKVTSTSISGEVSYSLTVLVHYTYEAPPPRKGLVLA